MSIITEKIMKHWKLGDLNWPMIIYISLAHVAATVGLFSIAGCKPATLLWAFILWPISGIGITGGVHRLWAHRSYKATLPLRVILMLANSIANQGSIWHWSRDHRVHHKHSETNADPHNATRGFFFAHMGWLFVKKHPDIIEAGKTLNFEDLANDSTVMFQKRLDPWFALFMCFVFPGLVACCGVTTSGMAIGLLVHFVTSLYCTSPGSSTLQHIFMEIIHTIPNHGLLRTPLSLYVL